MHRYWKLCIVVVLITVIGNYVNADCRYGCEANDCPCDCLTRKIQCSNKNVTEIGHFPSKAIYHRADFGGNLITILRRHQFKHKNMRNLHELQLSSNHLTTIEDGAFVGLQNLRTLYLSNNRIKVIRRETWTGLNSLKHLYLKNNLIEKIDGSCFEHIHSTLELLYLQQNRIQFISPRAFEKMTSLKTIDLSGNFISHMDGRFLSKTVALSFLFLSKNPWQCDDVTICSTMETLDRNEDIMLLDQVICHGPEKHKGKDGFDVLTELNCTNIVYPVYSEPDNASGKENSNVFLLFFSLILYFVLVSV
uniref:SLIT and NTRK-like protein 5 n=1 Tax=Ciona intestinalis TaxID=7719 RepID=F7BKN7_CIOIN|nr:SLIT and NTRK-like protein 5 [Ciona intestinalis]|eukprot:XP_002130708.1 SLIT and NTRK-like protein 5 [Ciona intestinalis]